ncbi:aerobic-type carbon monoxide dehydrogenase, small subunit, CoxS/CutS family [Desulfuromonas soudanensis]|uniref:Aerobic-type carbon monoxide dehydrogenase, small subunit, CoxS/CutS family n=1 Tax=Desulfuromonas soudanensis TaxID=1603606 RepID=A0A0M4CXP8_9BACT|nr:(2Fe-2S)-binding protein [Desulfuromonas soudanensis]ALC15027.1 aerobic-type carbon monoxide dehydrogenase, small subunit, CoxS/CutS family [Desulfuromonas soudanensis]
MITLNVNGQTHELDIPPDAPLLWVLREKLQLTGTKFGCGQSLCGACTVHVDGEATRSCVTAVSEVEGKKVVTVEGLVPRWMDPLKEAWLAEEVPQCGYCQPGQLMAAAALLVKNPEPSDAEIDAGMSGNICRCGTYPRIRKAIRRASRSAAEGRGV